jgi:hypothetical protein
MMLRLSRLFLKTHLMESQLRWLLLYSIEDRYLLSGFRKLQDLILDQILYVSYSVKFIMSLYVDYLIWYSKCVAVTVKPDVDYKATRLHFENLALRYGNPVIILNLIKASAASMLFDVNVFNCAYII